MRFKTIAAVATAAAALTLGTAGTSNAAQATQAAPAAVGHAAATGSHLMSVGHTAPAVAAGCGLQNIGSPGNYQTPDGYAGQVEQVYDSCNGDVYAHWQWSNDFIQRFGSRKLRVAVGSPSYEYDLPFWTDIVTPSQGKDVWFTNEPGQNYGLYHGWAGNDDWRAGAMLDESGCVAWGTLHNYNGYDEAGPYGGCNDENVPS
ncbi:hypothetical protein [Kitasatospora mediocidica]|uniref:hypothetical protein n=1 Tax=Kitasatospora mediocidica TaxID=58352 RepID=UPI000565F072|nr:hypothetical protein [Kitasatospora mediocidica]